MDIPSATDRVAPDLLKALAILSDTTVRGSVVEWEDLEPYRKSEKSISEIWKKKQLNTTGKIRKNNFTVKYINDHELHLFANWKTG